VSLTHIPALRQLSMLSAPAPNAAIWRSPPAIITVLKEVNHLVLGLRKLLWKEIAAASEKIGQAIADEASLIASMRSAPPPSSTATAKAKSQRRERLILHH